jgi:mRNA interferase MazF
MMSGDYIPDVGDIVWINFTPQSGYEQAGHRPAVVLSPKSYNARLGLMVCVPVTTKIKGYPFEVAIDDKSVALSDQIKSVDWESRDCRYKGKTSTEAITEIKANVALLLNI